ncbi:MAG: caspase family protein [Treponema sp.]|nr:caspase family protein [Treponema sp.]
MKKLLTVLFFLLAMNLFAQQKYALVIGNGNYTSFGKLQNVVNDANDMTEALQSIGFTVDKVLDGSRAQMAEAIIRLKNRLSVSIDTYGFVFYAGHGVQYNGENYLIPATADIPNENYLGETAIAVSTVLAELNSAGNKLNVVVLDACRDFPAAWSRSMSRGLTVVTNQPADSIIVYATSAGKTASDGTGRNGLFTSQLLKNLKTPGLEVNELFRRTGADVSQVSNRQQIPAVYNQFFGTAILYQTTGETAQQTSSSVNGVQSALSEFTGIIVPGGSLAAKLTWLDRNADSHNTYLVEVSSDESIDSYTFFYKGAVDITVVLKGDNMNRTISLRSDDSMFSVDSQVTLILDNNITLRGNNGNSTALVFIEGGTLKMNAGSVITGNLRDISGPTGGGGVRMNSGFFIMSGGTISGNSAQDGGGIAVVGESTFTMSGGTISGNSAQDGGGVSIWNGGTFIMNGGLIANNTASNIGGGVDTGDGILIKDGGIITGYSSDQSNGNAVRDDIGILARDGHAVWADTNTRKETTAGLNDSLTFGGSRGTTGAWDH